MLAQIESDGVTDKSINDSIQHGVSYLIDQMQGQKITDELSDVKQHMLPRIDFQMSQHGGDIAAVCVQLGSFAALSRLRHRSMIKQVTAKRAESRLQCRPVGRR